ncbi:hypothetical protein, partial [Pseudothermotoga sp.]
MSDQVVPVELTKRISTSDKIHMIFLVVYVFLSGFVFVEPSPAEIWFLVSVPFLLIGFKTTFQSLL